MGISSTPSGPWSTRHGRLHTAALARAKQAVADGYFLEAISICENVVADCLDADLTVALGRPRRKNPRLDALLREADNKRPGVSLSLCWSVKEWNNDKDVYVFDQTGEYRPWHERYEALESIARRGLALARKVRREVRSLAVERNRVAELSELETVQQRIDRVAEDLTTGQYRYARINTQRLAELLEVDFDDGSGHRFIYVYLRNLDDDTAVEHPFAENINLLPGRISQQRYVKLARLAEAIEGKPSAKDIKLTAREEATMRAAYQGMSLSLLKFEAAAPCWSCYTAGGKTWGRSPQKGATMKKSGTVIRRDQSDSPAARHLPLVDILVDAQAELQALVVASGLKVLEAMLEEDRVAVCGPR